MILYIKNKKDDSIHVRENIEKVWLKNRELEFNKVDSIVSDRMDLHEGGSVKIFTEKGYHIETIRVGVNEVPPPQL